MKIAVLHARQPLTTDLRQVFPGDECVVVSSGGPSFRADAGGSPKRLPSTITADRGDWPAALAEFKPDEVVTNDEYCLADCARLRDGLGMAARLPAYPLRYLDKVLMKRELAAAGITVPQFWAFEPVVTRAAAETVTLPAVVKPRQEANSRGVRVLHTVAELREWLAAHEGEAGWEAEEFVAGVGHHVNSLVRAKHVEPVQVGRYLGPLLDLPIGSISAEYDSLHKLNEKVVAALGFGEMIVHTELIVRPDGEPVVVEVAGRAPGGDVPRMALRHAGVQLEAAHLRLQAGLPVESPKRTGLDAAWIWLSLDGEPPVPESPHEIRVREKIVSVVLWNDDPAQLAADVDAVLRAGEPRP